MLKIRMQRIRDAAAAAPLVAALVAPLSTLLEIPALTVSRDPCVPSNQAEWVTCPPSNAGTSTMASKSPIPQQACVPVRFDRTAGPS